MGTRSMGGRPWLMADAARGDELALKRSLIDERRDAVFAIAADVDPELVETMSVELGAMIERAMVERASGELGSSEPHGATHPLERAALGVQEDLCLLQQRTHGDAARWCLDAASVCFPSRWRLPEKIGLPMIEVHGPVPDYDVELASRVDSLLTALANRPVGDRRGDGVHRRNWFLHPDGRLFQPDRPAHEPALSGDACLDGLFLRSERQTLRPVRVPGLDPWIVFTIRTQQATLREVVADSDRRARLRSFLSDAPADQRLHRGVSDEQLPPLLDLL